MPQLLIEVLVLDGFLTVTGVASVIKACTVCIPAQVTARCGSIDPGQYLIDLFAGGQIINMQVSDFRTCHGQGNGQQFAIGRHTKPLD